MFIRYSWVYTGNQIVFQVISFPWFVLFFVFRWYWLFVIVNLTSLFHLLTFLSSPLRIYRYGSNLYKTPQNEIITSGSEDERNDCRQWNFWGKVYTTFELENYYNFVVTTLSDLMNFHEFQHYFFDRYIFHAPFCVLRWNYNNDSSYFFKGIQLTKHDGYKEYLELKHLETDIFNNSSSVTSVSSNWDIKKKVKKIKKYKQNEKGINKPNNLKKKSKSLPTKLLVKYNKASDLGKNQTNLIEVQKKITKIIKMDPNSKLIGRESNEHIFSEDNTKINKKKEPEKEEDEVEQAEENSFHQHQQVKKIVEVEEEEENCFLEKFPENTPLISVLPPTRQQFFDEAMNTSSIGDIEKPKLSPKSLKSHRIKFSTKWNQMMNQDKFKSRNFSIPFDSSQIFNINNKKLREISIKLPNNQVTQLKLKIIKNHSHNNNNNNNNNLTFIKSIDVNESEYIEKIIQAIIETLPHKGYDDGSLAPIILRLAWHCCATYDKTTGLGGSNGATMRFLPEMIDEGNTGLDIARAALEPIKQKFPRITYSDLWTLAGKVAIEQMGGPKINWKCGRFDCLDDRFVPENGRLPFANKDANHVRNTFERMGFSDQETVALVGAHSMGRCHKKFSGWDGKWTNTPTKFSNQFFVLLCNETWVLDEVPETNKFQFYNHDKTLMMLNTDLELIRDSSFCKWAKIYAESESRFMNDFSLAFSKLLELGIVRDDFDQVVPKI